jgi:ribosomal protein S18 acetylase RimI-like enzyme
VSTPPPLASDEAKWLPPSRCFVSLPTPFGRLRPFSSDPAIAELLLTESIQEAYRRSVPAQDPTRHIAHTLAELRAGRWEGRLHSSGGDLDGLVVWEPGYPAGLHVGGFYLRPPAASVARYESFLGDVERECGPVAFLPGNLAGISIDEERRLMAKLGFAPFGRSEMRFPPEAAVPAARHPPGIQLRPLALSDEAVVASLHAAAFGPSFDFYLFQIDRDPVRDSELAVRDMLSGRYGNFLPEGSFLAETNAGVARGASVFVRAPYGPLLVSVHVDPTAQGHGIGEALVVASIRALRARGETVLALNVTEGNRRAVALYERLGFVRSIGPDWGWYSRQRVPVSPDGTPTPP